MSRHPSFLLKITILDIFYISLSPSLFLSLSLYISLLLWPVKRVCAPLQAFLIQSVSYVIITLIINYFFLFIFWIIAESFEQASQLLICSRYVCIYFFCKHFQKNNQISIFKQHCFEFLWWNSLKLFSLSQRTNKLERLSFASILA